MSERERDFFFNNAFYNIQLVTSKLVPVLFTLSASVLAFLTILLFSFYLKSNEVITFVVMLLEIYIWLLSAI